MEVSFPIHYSWLPFPAFQAVLLELFTCHFASFPFFSSASFSASLLRFPFPSPVLLGLSWQWGSGFRGRLSLIVGVVHRGIVGHEL